MLIFKIDPAMSQTEFVDMASMWDKTNDPSFEGSNLWSTEDIDKIFNLAISSIPCQFAYIVLGELAKMNNTSANILRKILGVGHQHCIESVCLRVTLADDMIQLCGQISEHQNEN